MWKIRGNNVSELAGIEVQEGKNMDELVACSRRSFRFDLVQAASQPQKQAFDKLQKAGVGCEH